MDNDGDIDNSDISALKNVLNSKNTNLERYENTYKLFDQNNDQLISTEEAEASLNNYRDAISAKDASYDLNLDGRVNGHDMNIISNMIQADLGIDVNIEGDNDTVIRNLLNFIQDHAERKNEIFDLQDAKLEEYYESAGETYSTRAQFHHKVRLAKYAENHQNMAGAYNNSLIHSIANKRAATSGADPARATAINARLKKLNTAAERNQEIHKTATQMDPENPNWQGGFESWEKNVEQRVMSSLELHKERAAIYSLSFRDADESTVAQLDTLFDTLELTYADYYNNRHKWNLSVNENNSLIDKVDANPDKERNIAAADFAMTSLRSMWRLIYSSRYQSKDLNEELDNRYDAGLKDYIDEYLTVREKLSNGVDFGSSEIEKHQDSLETKYDLLMSLGKKEEGTIKAVNFSDKDGDGLISSEEKIAALQSFDYGMKMNQLFTTNDLAISNKSAELMSEYDFNNDGLINELDYDVLDNAVGRSDEFGIHNVLNIINKQTKVHDYLTARIALEGEEENPMVGIKDFLAQEIEFDQDIKNNYWKIGFTNNNAFNATIEEVEILRLQVMDAMENGAEVDSLIQELNIKKADLVSLTPVSNNADSKVEFLRSLNAIDNNTGVLVHKYLTEPNFFTTAVLDHLEYIKGSAINSETLVNLLLEDPEEFKVTRGYLESAEKLELVDNFDQILSGNLSADQINFLKAIGKYTESKNFIDNQAENEVFLTNLIDNFFDQGEVSSEGLSTDHKEYLGLMTKYLTEFDTSNITDSASELVDQMLATLFNNKTLATLTKDSKVQGPSTVTRGRGGRGSRGGARRSNSSSQAENTSTFYSNVKSVFESTELNSLEALRDRDSLISQLDLTKEDSAENKAVINQLLDQQRTKISDQIEARHAQIDKMQVNRFSRFQIQKLTKEIRSLDSALKRKTELKALFV